MSRGGEAASGTAVAAGADAGDADPVIRVDRVRLAPRPGMSMARFHFSVREGAFAVAEENPPASTAILRALVGIERPVDGTLEVLGVRPAEAGREELQRFRRRLGVAFRTEGLVSNLSVRLNLVVPISYSGAASGAAAESRADELIEAFDLGDWRDARPADVPSPVRKRTAIARAVGAGPELLLLEDPLSNLDPAEARTVLEFAREACETVFVVAPHRRGPLTALADDHPSLHGEPEVARAGSAPSEPSGEE